MSFLMHQAERFLPRMAMRLGLGAGDVHGACSRVVHRLLTRPCAYRDMAMRLQRQEQYEVASMRYTWEAEERKRQAAAAAAAAQSQNSNRSNSAAGNLTPRKASFAGAAQNNNYGGGRPLLADHLPAQLRGNNEGEGSSGAPNAWGMRGASESAALLPTPVWGGGDPGSGPGTWSSVGGAAWAAEGGEPLGGVTGDWEMAGRRGGGSGGSGWGTSSDW